MAITTKDNNIFKYVHFRPAKPIDEIDNRTTDNPSDRLSRAKKKGISKNNAVEKRVDRLLKVHDDLASLDLTKHLEKAKKTDSKQKKDIFLINREGRLHLKNSTTNLLDELKIDLRTTSHIEVFNKLNLALAETTENQTQFDFIEQEEPQQGYIQAVGIAQLLVVKQQIKRYEAGEIAHIENVLAGEGKIRTHKYDTRSEQIFSTINENTTDSESEFENTETYELNKESSETFQKDTELSGELSLSGKYGPTISFESNFKGGQTKSESELDSEVTNFAKDTVERSKERIVEKTTTERKTILIRETKETNEHTLNNAGPDHDSAIYQYVDKIYESQVFDYGKRQMFDFMIPEPSSYLWYLKESSRLNINAQEPITLPENGINDATDITTANYLFLGTIYGVADLPIPPSIFKTKRLKLNYGDGSVNDSGSHKAGVSEELDIPEGYRPYTVYVTILATSDEHLHFSINVGDTIVHLTENDFDETNVGSGSGNHKKYSLSSIPYPIFNSSNDSQNDSSEKLFIDIYSWEAGNYSVHLEVIFMSNNILPFSGFDIEFSWKQEVYAALLEAYQNTLLQFQQDAAFEEANAQARESESLDFGTPPAINKNIIQNELKKHCLAIIRDEHLGNFVVSHSGEPPQFDLQEAHEKGEVVRFLENAFEWGQIQYVFYPYFWSRPGDLGDGWFKRFSAKNADYNMAEFLSAGYARIVVPVREGFDSVVTYFIENGVPYDGEGEPQIGNPLYRSIIEEIKDRTDAGQDEVPVDEPWETRLPTAAVIVRTKDSLPSWEKVTGTDWDWVPED